MINIVSQFGVVVLAVGTNGWGRLIAMVAGISDGV